MGYWENKRVLVTGARGFLGTFVHAKLFTLGCKQIFTPTQQALDLKSFGSVDYYVSKTQPDIVIHLAGLHGGLEFITKNVGRCYYENLTMNLNLMEASRINAVVKYVSLGSTSSYPDKYLRYKEKYFWEGLPDGPVGLYGMAKKMAVIQALAYREQYDFNAIHLIFGNLYGPWGVDQGNKERNHVQEALIKAFCEAKKKNTPVEIWGSGEAVREFTYAEDAATGILLAAEVYNDPMPLNIGTGKGTSIRDLVKEISEAIDFTGELHWDLSKPEGKKMSVCDVTRMREILRWEPPTSLKEGIKATCDWYLTNYPTPLL